MTEKKAGVPGRRLSLAVMLFFFLAFLLLALKRQSRLGYLLSVAVPVLIWLGTSFLPHLFPTDRLLMSLANFLCALGVLVLFDTNPAYALQQAVSYGIGLAAMIFCICLVRMARFRKKLIWLMIPCSLLLLVLPLVLGKEINGAKNWVSLGALSFQPSEIVKLSLILILAFSFSRGSRGTGLLFVLICLGLLMLQKDLGTALLYFSVTLLMYWISTGNLVFTSLGILGGAGAAVFGYHQFAHVRRRVAVWLNPWADYENAGYQIVQGLMAIASGGLWGVGLGLGTPTAIPVYESDYIFAVICEQFGLIFGVCVLLIYAALIWRGTEIALASRRSFYGLLAMGSTALIGMQAFVILGGVLKLLPLTGVTLPFVSYGGTSLISSLCLIGFIQGVGSVNEDHLAGEARLRVLSGR